MSMISLKIGTIDKNLHQGPCGWIRQRLAPVMSARAHDPVIVAPIYNLTRAGRARSAKKISLIPIKRYVSHRQ